MTFISRKLLSGVLLAAMASMPLATPAQAESVTLRYSQWLPATYPLQVEIIDPWFEEIARVTEGRVKIVATPKVVGTVAGQYDVLVDGLADVALVVPGYTPGRFPLTEGLELPFLGDDPRISMPVSYRAYETYLEPSGIFKEIVPLAVFTGNPAHIALRSGEVTALPDLAGKKLRSPQQAASASIDLLDAVPVSKPMSEVYELASSGAIDGGIIPPDTLLGFKLAGTMKEYLLVPGGIVNTVNMLAFSHEAWDRISPEDQAAIREVSGLPLVTQMGEIYARSLEEAVAAMPDEGMRVQTLPDNVVADLKARLEPIRTGWFEVARKHGLDDPEAMIDFFETEYAAGKAAQ
ncbi:TRAP-type C4-dicarboxylate transport system, substrate-binding protein [Paracoccus alkenifer]|uniref:TRAP-type C4-dicarboxylate transport system, substrate-binding protein n=2 Tax=Paracoccus alkenifer TaxID=65735 RepID=A0A1H6NG62_9RHOB|nr:TRAP-type C4-dicarboxylate transport system, substrate-binding protein [Paracoccus alkenifer]